MDRNVFAMIAATVFLLTMIIATIQMQLAMIEDAAEEVESDYGAYSYPIAGSMYILNADSSSSNEIGYIYGSELDDRLNNPGGAECTYEDESGVIAPGFANDEILGIEHSISGSTDVSTSCGAPTFSLSTDLAITIMRLHDESGDTEVSPETLRVTQDVFPG